MMSVNSNQQANPATPKGRRINVPALISTKVWFWIVLVTALIGRLKLLVVYQPVAYSDTPSYRRLAESVLNGFQRYDGTRTPGYPAFLALVGADERVFLAQMAMGILISLLLFYIGWQLSGQAWLGGLAAMAHTMNLGQLFFEANLLTETLTTFWIALSLAGLFYLLLHPQQHSIWLAVGLGVSATLAALTRPLFVYLPFWMLIFILIPLTPFSGAKRIKIAQAIVFLLPVALILGGWVNFIHTRFHVWSLTTMTGYHLVQHTGSFFEYVPDQYAVLRDIYLDYREAHISQYGTQTNTIWEAIPDMQKASGLSFYDLSRTLARISLQLIRAHPDLYLRNVLQGWWMFWRAPVYWSAEAVCWEGLASFLRPIILVERLLLVAANLVFVLGSIASLFFRRLLPMDVPRRIFHYCLTGTIWGASILQTLLDHGDNPRFLVPLQSFVVLWVLWFGYSYFSHKKRLPVPQELISE